MSRRQSRARKRLARSEQAEAEFSIVRNDPAALADWLERRAASDTPIWPIAQAASRSRPLDDEERAMVAQAVAPRLAGKTPGSVRDRPNRGKKSPVSRITPSD